MRRSDAVLACDLEPGDRVRTGRYSFHGDAGAVVAWARTDGVGRCVYAYDADGHTIGQWHPGETVWLVG